MNIGIVTVWDERGAGYVSKIYKDYLSKHFNVFVYNRGYSKNKLAQDEFIFNSRKVSSIKPMSIHKNEFKKWIDFNKIETILFNEQQSWEPILWCKKWSIKTIAYIDYYTEDTIIPHNAYDMVICNTKRHLEAFSDHHNPVYLKWGTNLEIFKPNLKDNLIPVFLHSCGYSPSRKGTDIVVKSFLNQKSDFRLIIHTQIELNDFFESHEINIGILLKSKKLEIINDTIPAPGLYYLADYYVYPTKLEGIGLTVLESISSGLLPIIPDQPPMNEFVPPNYSYKIKIDKKFSRSDGYYWPQVNVSQNHLDQIVRELIINHNNVERKNLRDWAIENFDLNNNFKGLEDLFKNLKFKKIDLNTKNAIINFENKRPINHNRLLQIINPILNFLYNIFKFFRFI